MQWPDLHDRLERAANWLRQLPDTEPTLMVLDADDLQILLTALTEYEARRELPEAPRWRR